MALYNQGDIINEFLVRMNVSTTVAFYTDAILTRWASNAHQWAASRYKWPMTEGRFSTTFATRLQEDGYTVLEYPEGFRADSVRLLTIGGKEYKKTNFYKFRKFLEDNTQDTTKIFSDFGGRLLINPNASDLSGTAVMWGQINVAPLASDSNIQVPTALTIFSGVEEDGNEAIVELMMGYAKQREKTQTAVVKGQPQSAALMHAQKAGAMLDAIWKRIQDEQFAYQDSQNEGMFKRFDVLRGGFSEDLFKRDQWSF